MNENKIIFEGFWDTLITKAKQGAYAVAGAAGSGTAKGKLTVSLLSDAMYSQFKEYIAATGSDVNPTDFKDFLGRMGYSPEFVSVETNQFKKFLSATDPINNPARREPTGNTEAPADAEAEAEPGQQAPRPEQGRRNRRPFPNSSPAAADSGNAAQPAANAQDNAQAEPADQTAQPAAEPAQSNNMRNDAQQQMHQRMQQKRANGPRARAKTREGIEDMDESILTEKVSDSALRKFFDTLAQRALKTGEAKSAATKTIADTRTSNDSGEDAPAAAPAAQGQAAPAQPAAPAAQPQAQAQPAAQPAPAQAQAQPAAQAAPATDSSAQAQPAQPATPATPKIDYSQEEKALLDRYGNTLPNQIGSADKEVTALARKIMRSAVSDYIAQFGGAPAAAQPAAQPANGAARPARPKRKPLPGAKPAGKVQPQAAPTQQAAPANQPAANQANPQAPAA